LIRRELRMADGCNDQSCCEDDWPLDGTSGAAGVTVKLAWNNPNPKRTSDRPGVWEVTRRNGTIRVIRSHVIQTRADRNLDHGMNQLFSVYWSS
jgi:hypothetical protein